MNITDWTKLPPEVKRIFTKYRILNGQDGYTTANLRKSRDAEGKSLGSGHLISLDALGRILAADASPGYQWLDWMLFQCGGGAEAERRSAQALEQVKDRFVEERIRGYRDMRGQYHAPIEKEEAQEKWAAADNKFKDVLAVGDQDMVEKLQVFGFYRNWPGFNKVYETAVQTVSQFISLKEKIVEMNTHMSQHNLLDKMVKILPSDYTSLDTLGQAVKKVERFFASLAARQDIRIETIYEDDSVSVICPLTYAAAVRYGWDLWPFANRHAFEQNLETTNAWNDAWKNTTGKESKIIVYIRLKVPVPSWITCVNKKFSRCSLQNLALIIPKTGFHSFTPDTAQFLNEEGHADMRLSNIRQMLVDEVTRDTTAEEDFPVRRGMRVYESKKEAAEVFRKLEKAMSEISEWTKRFDGKRVVSEYLTVTDT